MSEWITLVAEKTASRLDAFIAEQCEELTRSYVRTLIDNGGVRVNGAVVTKAGTKLKAGQQVEVEIPDPKNIEALPENLPLDIVYQDRDMIVVNKARGMVVHPAAGNETGTLVNALLYHVKDLSGIGGEMRPGIVHRIDKDTTGLLVAAKNDAAHHSLAQQIHDHTAGREYIALVEGCISKDQGTVNAPIARHPADRKKMAVVKGGREAVTHFTVLARYPANVNGAGGSGATLVKCRLETGRTHQIRVHMAYIGHPVVSDPLYGSKPRLGLSAQALHAYRLHLAHPATGEEMVFCAPLPEDFAAALKKLGGGSMPVLE